MAVFVELANEQALREQAMKRFGYTKGSIKEAVTEAVTMWIAAHAREVPPVPLSALRGVLKGVKVGSVDLKHAAVGLFAR